MTLKLCGFAASNYFNKVKLQLLEKDVPFEEERVWTGNTHPLLMDRSPMGKVPFLNTPSGPISESSACAEYIETVYPQRPLLPADPYAAAKVRELIIYMELHLELVARELYAEAFFGGTVSEEVKDKARANLAKGIACLKRNGKFSPYVAGDTFTYADIMLMYSVGLAASCAKRVLGISLLEDFPEVKTLTDNIAQRESAIKIAADQKAG